MKKPSRISELRALSEEDFYYELQFNLQKDVAKKYNVSSSMVSKEKCIRDEMKTENLKLNRNEFEVVSRGAWTNSIERKSYVNAGLMNNISIKYNKQLNK